MTHQGDANVGTVFGMYEKVQRLPLPQGSHGLLTENAREIFRSEYQRQPALGAPDESSGRCMRQHRTLVEKLDIVRTLAEHFTYQPGI